MGEKISGTVDEMREWISTSSPLHTSTPHFTWVTRHSRSVGKIQNDPSKVAEGKAKKGELPGGGTGGTTGFNDPTNPSNPNIRPTTGSGFVTDSNTEGVHHHHLGGERHEHAHGREGGAAGMYGTQPISTTGDGNINAGGGGAFGRAGGQSVGGGYDPSLGGLPTGAPRDGTYQ